MRLPRGARIAIVGAGPSGVVTAKHALDARFDATVFDAADDLGGQWYSTASHSGIWPGMHANTSRAMTAFSDAPAPEHYPLHPSAEQVHAYLRAYADRFGVAARIRLRTPVRRVATGWDVDGERFDGVVIASGRFRKPHLPAGLEAFGGELLHSFDYPGAEPFRGRRALVYGNGISGLEIASDLARVTEVVSAFRKPRYVIQKNVDGVSSDWQWYTAFGALERRHLSRDEFSAAMRERVLRVAGNPAAFGAPEPDPDFPTAGLALCQDWLGLVDAGRVSCRPAIAGVEGRRVTFTNGTSDEIDAIICATGYDLDIPYLDDGVWDVVGPEFALYQRTLHPDLPGFGVVGHFFAQGPYFPLLELQGRWIVALWAGEVAAPDPDMMRGALAPAPPIDPHNALAAVLADELGVAPDPLAWPDLAEPLMFGPMLPPRYRFNGPGAQPDAPDRFAEQLAASPRPPVDPDHIDALRRFGLDDVADLIATESSRAAPAASPAPRD
jgi:dimethylaniline monooxygenase (N-oxide forming)